jgi:hypothetical protein
MRVPTKPGTALGVRRATASGSRVVVLVLGIRTLIRVVFVSATGLLVEPFPRPLVAFAAGNIKLPVTALSRLRHRPLHISKDLVER